MTHAPVPARGNFTATRTPPTIVTFAKWCAANGAPIVADGTDYESLWRWSVTQPADFWLSLQRFFDVHLGGSTASVVTGDMPNTRWFDGAQLNYVDRILGPHPSDTPAILDLAESARGGSFDERVLTWSDLAGQVAAFAATLRSVGVGEGDRVVGYLPDIAEGVVAFLATASLGAVWASCGQDYAPTAAASRFAQLEPVVLVAADGYRFGGRARDRRDAVAELLGHLSTVRASFLVSELGSGPVAGCRPWDDALSTPAQLDPIRVPFSHPLWVLFSSGTTGRPKGIVHGHGGVVLEHLKSLGLHLDLRAGERFAWYTTPSWMVWNYRTSGLLLGATIVCYPGSATIPSPSALWALAARCRLNVLGASPGFLAASEAAGLHPGLEHDLHHLRAFGSSGSSLPAAADDWIHAHVGSHVAVQSSSGGTDVVSAFAGGAPTLPIYPGEMSGRALGVALEAWDPDGTPATNGAGELVITQPMPSMPLYLWDDRDGSRYRETYFSTYPDVWRHGDWVTVTDRGTVIVHGRSDSTLNRHGVRMGSAEIYQAVEAMPEVAEALVIGAEQSGEAYWMPLFVRLAEDVVLSDELVERIRNTITRDASPRHLPDDIVAIDAIPHTITGKKLEVPIKRILQGVDWTQAVDQGALDDPTALAQFIDYRDERIRRESTLADADAKPAHTIDRAVRDHARST